MRIVNPSFGISATSAEKVALKPVNWATDAIALVSNSKPNARELLAGIREKLGANRKIDNIDFLSKNSASQPAPADVLEKVAANYSGALLAIADGGSCSSWSFHDSIELEKRGIPAYVIATETFKPLVLAQAKARKVEPRLIVVKHPIGGLNADELRERIEAATKGLTEATKK